MSVSTAIWRVAALTSAVLLSVQASAAEIRVGALRGTKTLAAAVNAAKAGDRIIVDPGIYLNDTATVNASVTIEAAGAGVILRATTPLANRKGFLITNTDVTVRGLTFDGAEISKSDGNNAAGIRHQAGQLTVEDCTFNDNQNGILTNSSDTATLTIRRSVFSGNGAGDGYTHGVYANVIARLIISDSTFAGTRAGHDIKSRAKKTEITDTILDDGVNGTPSYAVDLPNGGEAVLDGLVITQGSKTSNTTMVAFGAEGSLHAPSRLTVKNSTLVNTAANSTGIYNFTSTAAELINNTFQNVGQVLRGPGEVSKTEAPAAVINAGAVFAAGTDSLSFLRFFNGGSEAARVTVKLFDGGTGKQVAAWTSPAIAPGAAPQFSIGTIEEAAGAGLARPASYTLSIETDMEGTFQHALFRSLDGTLTNLSTCDSAPPASRRTLANVHSSLLDSNYPSTVVLVNSGNAAAPASLRLLDARDGRSLGGFTTSVLPAHGQIALPIAAVEAAIGLHPDAAMFHYDLRLEGTFTGILQHLVNNRRSGVISDMSAVCALAD